MFATTTLRRRSRAIRATPTTYLLAVVLALALALIAALSIPATAPAQIPPAEEDVTLVPTEEDVTLIPGEQDVTLVPTETDMTAPPVGEDPGDAVIRHAAPPGSGIRADFDGDGYADLAIGVPDEDFAATNDGGVHVIYGGPLSGAQSQFWSQNSAGIFGTPENGDRFGSELATGHYNDDRYADLAIGVPDEDYAATDDGGVHVLYGSAGGLTASGSQFWSQNSTGVFGTAENGDRFGSVLTAADVGATSHDDLAIGVPAENYAAVDDGGVHVLYGSTSGLTASGSQFWSQDSPGVFGGAENDDQFGSVLTAAKLGGTTHADLAIGVPYEDYAATNDGGVHVLYGSSAGLTAAGSQFWSQDSAGVFGGAEDGDLFGRVLTAANFGGTTYDDLAIAVPDEDYAATDDGGVHVLYGAAAGLTAAGSQFWSQDSAGVFGGAENYDEFGSALTAANLGGTSHADLVIGVPDEDYAATNDGGVHVLYGSAARLTATGSQFWSQDSAGVFGTAEDGDRFGSSLTAANYGASAHADLAVGVPSENFAAIDDGGVHVLYGSAASLTASGNEFWSQNSAGIFGTPEEHDHFGSALSGTSA